MMTAEEKKETMSNQQLTEETTMGNETNSGGSKENSLGTSDDTLYDNMIFPS